MVHSQQERKVQCQRRLFFKLMSVSGDTVVGNGSLKEIQTIPDNPSVYLDPCCAGACCTFSSQASAYSLQLSRKDCDCLGQSIYQFNELSRSIFQFRKLR